MKINISLMRFSPASNHFEIINEIVDADKIILDTKAKRYEITVRELKDKKMFGYPNQFIRCLIMTEKQGVRKMHGYFTKVAIYLDINEGFLGIISLEETLYREDVKKYFKNEYPKIKKAMRVDVQTISIEDFLIQSKVSLMQEARALFKRRKNVK